MRNIYPVSLTVVVVISAPFLLINRGWAIMAELEPAKDNTLYEHPNGLLSNGAGPGFFAGRNGNGNILRGLIMFDIAGELPSEATVKSVDLTLHVSAAANSVSDVIELHRVEAEWGEAGTVANLGSGGGGAGGIALPGEATWTHRISPSDAWNDLGGDFDATASATLPVGDIGDYSWSSTQLATDVQMWLDDPVTNFGWLLSGNENFSGTAKRFDTRENPTSEFRPVLNVEYILPSTGADFDGDGDVDADDLSQWEGDFGENGESDADGDGDSDGHDFLVWQQQFTEPAGPSDGSSPIPEPASSAIFWCAVLAGLLRHRTRETSGGNGNAPEALRLQLRYPNSSHY